MDDIQIIQINLQPRFSDKKFMTSKQTLQKFPESKLAKMLTESVPGITSRARGYFEIDRDPTLFSIILNFMRDGEVSLPWMFDNWDALKTEALFYGLPCFIEALKGQGCNLPKPLPASDMIRLNVGGYHYSTCLENLTANPESMLGRMFKSQLNSATDSRGAYFIDRDGALFGIILSYLRSGSLNIPDDFRYWDQLKKEGEFFQLGADFEAAVSSAHNKWTPHVMISADGSDLILLGLEHVQKYLDSPLNDIFHGKFTAKDIFVLDNGNIAIDRDGEIFKYIANYLRFGRPFLPVDFSAFGKLRSEASYYKIHDLIDKIDNNNQAELRLEDYEYHDKQDEYEEAMKELYMDYLAYEYEKDTSNETQYYM